MKRMIIFEPAMCCSTGVCGPSVDSELLRVATVINTLQKKDAVIERHNLTNNPQIFVDNKTVNELLNNGGIEILPIVMVDDVVVKTKAYPSNKEFCEMLGLPESSLKTTITLMSGGCSCNDGCC
jgi:hypothetical protein